MSFLPYQRLPQQKSKKYHDMTEETLHKVAEKLSDYLQQTQASRLRVTITDHSIFKYKNSKFVSYKIVVEKNHTNWTIWRRYSDFYNLHQYLKKHYNLYGLSFPGKTFFVHYDDEFIFNRMKELNSYLYQISHNEQITKDSVYIDFIQLKEHPSTVLDL